jgi:competence protein ComEC
LSKEETPEFISITLKSYDPNLMTGQRVHLRTGLFPPPEPSVPGGFDFQRYFYFRQIGAVGYGIPPLDAESLKDSGASDFDIWFAEFRHRLTESIRSYFHEPAGAVAAAFITGETRAIPDEINNDMRIAGLYHLLAVSGMNLSVVAGIAFFSLRLLLASISSVALRFNIKKWAAFLALIASYIYLRVSGSPVSAERAFFMVSLIFIAILLDRDPTPMRSVAIAAFCILLYEPEAVLTASFQLSFSATAALIASYEWGSNLLAKKSRESGFGIRRITFYFAAVMVTSFIAWCATEPFIIYHFNQFSSYSLIANTIAEPLVSFLLMPLVIAGVLLLPFGLAKIAFAPMQYGVDMLLHIAHWTAGLPHAMWIVPNPDGNGFLCAVLGGIWIYFWKARWRWCGIIAVVAGMSTAFSYAPPDIFISGDGKHIAVRLDDGRMAMLKGRSTNINAQSWARAAIEQGYVEKDDIPMQCDDKGCVITLKKRKVAVLKDPAAFADECSLSDIIITGFPVAGTACNAMVVDKNLLDKNGGAALWLKDGQITMKQTRLEQGNRPWVQ